MSLNGVGLLLAILNIWTYPRRYTGAFILGNLLFAILMRNELFGRLLYLFVNKAFAKVSPKKSDERYLAHTPNLDYFSGHPSGSG